MPKSKSTQFKIIAFVVCVGILALALLIPTVLDRFESGMCGNRIIKSILSPDSTMEVLVFTRDCGATTDFSTQISVVKTGTKLKNESGNLFVADSNHGAATTQEFGGPIVSVEWADQNNIKVKYSRRARIFQAKNMVKEIKVEYEELGQ